MDVNEDLKTTLRLGSGTALNSFLQLDDSATAAGFFLSQVQDGQSAC
jgi:hypothetical protein